MRAEAKPTVLGWRAENLLSVVVLSGGRQVSLTVAAVQTRSSKARAVGKKTASGVTRDR